MLRIGGSRLHLRPDWERVVEGELEQPWRGMAGFGARRAQALASVRTGELRSSISAEVVRTGGLRMRLQATAPHAVYVERGTSDTPAQPFLRPAGLEAAKAVKSGLAVG